MGKELSESSGINNHYRQFLRTLSLHKGKTVRTREKLNKNTTLSLVK